MSVNQDVHGNAAAAIDALRYILHQIDNNPDKLSAGDLLCIIGDKAEAALKKPPRQCDVGTAEEQTARYVKYCRQHAPCDNKCPLNKTYDCKFTWSQMPCESEVKE